MKRKLIELGGSLYASLPSSYTKENNLEKGAEIFINQNKGELTISTSPKTKGDSYNIEFNKNEMFIIKRYVTALYRRGYSKIKIKHDKGHKEIIEEVREILTRTTIGFEIISQTQTEIIIQSFANEDNAELDNTLRRSLYLIKELINASINSFSNENYNIREVENMDIEIDKFTNYCLRLIFKGSNIGSYKNIILYNFIKNLEYFADSICILCRYARLKNYKLNKFETELIKEISKMFDEFIKLYSNFSITQSEKTVSIRMKIRRLLNKKNSKIEFEIRNIVRRFNDTLSNLIELQF
jgi:hypothetical protein